MLALVDQLVKASDYVVRGAVMAPIPVGAPVIQKPQDNTVIQSSDVTIEGTCPVIVPATLIAVYDNDELIGSGVCSSEGSFSLPITLSYGSHVIIAKVLTITDEFGESSAPITINRPRVMPPSAGGKPVPAGVDARSSVPGVETIMTPVRITPREPFVTLSGDNKALWQGTITGGKMPYRVSVDWGDGTIDTRTVRDNSEQTFSHDYSSAKIYDITITAVDDNDETAVLHSVGMTLALQRSSVLDTNRYESGSPLIAFIQKNFIQIYIVTFSGLLFLWYFEHGWHYTRRVFVLGIVDTRRKNQKKHKRKR